MMSILIIFNRSVFYWWLAASHTRNNSSHPFTLCYHPT